MIRSVTALAALFLMFAGLPAMAQVPRSDSRAPIRLSYAPIVKAVAPAVVNVYGARVEQVRNAFFDDPIFRRFFGDQAGQPRREEVARSLGSGVIIDRSGLIVTNNHVIENMTEVKVSLADRREFDVEILLRDPRTDLAVLRLKDAPKDLTAIEIGDSEKLEVGDLVLAVGNPFGVGQTVTSGIVSALARTRIGVSDYQFFIQTDAAINPGNSGGALVDIDGKLIGINTAIYSRSGGSVGIGFAVPVTMVRIVIDSARGGNAVVRRPWFGARLQVVTAEIAEGLGLAKPVGTVVTGLSKDGPAAKAGLKIGDIILTIDGFTVDDPDSFGFRFATRPLGGKTTLDVLRRSEKLKLAIALEAAPETVSRDIYKALQRGPFAGASFGNLSPALAEEVRLEPDQTGVVVTEVEPQSAAAQVGLQVGDILRSLNDQEISSTAQLPTLLSSRPRAFKITIERGGQQLTTVVGG